MSKITAIDAFLPLTDNLLTSGQPTREQFKLIAQLGVKTVINLALETSPNALPDEDQLVTDLGMEYLHIPVLWENPTREALEKLMDALDGQKEGKVLIHCAKNMRVSAFMALYRIQRLGWRKETAFQQVYKIWDPAGNKTWREFIDSILENHP